MSSPPAAGYKLRPNKAVDRELFLSLLQRLSATLNIEDYRYIGLGGPFLEDFRMVHARVGISDMVCVDSDLQTHKRQNFNRPIETVLCVHSTLEDYLAENEQEKPVVLWLDFTEPGSIVGQIESFVQQIAELPVRSILRITLNANASSLGGDSEYREYLHSLGETEGKELPSIQQWRLERLKARLEKYLPAEIYADDVAQKKYGVTLLTTLVLAAQSALLKLPGRDFEWCLSTQYSDGQFMITSTGMIIEEGDTHIRDLLGRWEYASAPSRPHVIDLPALSTLERLTMEAAGDPQGALGYELSTAYSDSNPFETFKKFYRVFPHFSRIEV